MEPVGCPLAPVAEAVVAAADDVGGVEAAAEKKLDIRLPGQLHHIPVKAADQHLVDLKKALNQPLAVPHRVNQPRSPARDQRGGGRVKGQRRRRQPQPPCRRFRLSQKGRVTQVNAVKEPEGDHTFLFQGQHLAHCFNQLDVLPVHTSKKLFSVRSVCFSSRPTIKNVPSRP